MKTEIGMCAHFARAAVSISNCPFKGLDSKAFMIMGNRDLPFF